MSKYRLAVCFVFLLIVTWFIGSPVDWMKWVPLAFLVLLYVPMSYEVAIEEKDVLKGIISSLSVFLFSLLVFFTIAFLMGLVGAVLVPLSNPEEGPFIILSLQILAPEQDVATFLLWNFAGFNAIFLLWAEIEFGEKKVEKKEDPEPEEE